MGHLYKYLLNGASAEMNVDGSSTPVTFELVPGSNEIYIVERLNFIMRDTGTIEPTGYGAGAALGAGIKIEWRDANDVVLLEYTDGLPIKNNYEWGALAGPDAQATEHPVGPGDDTHNVRFSLFKSGAPLTLRSGHKLVVVIQDNLTGLVLYRCQAQGTTRNVA